MDIKKKVTQLIKKHNTSDPFKLADLTNIAVQFGDLGGKYLGNYIQYRRSKIIIIDQLRTPANRLPFICAHELGHAICTPKDNTRWLKNYTMSINADKVERQANTFAVELLLPDELLREYECHSIYTLASMVGVPQELVGLKKT